MQVSALLATALLGLAGAVPTNFTTDRLATRATSSFWYANMKRDGAARGYAPDLDNDYNYPVYVTVNANDGNSLQNAISSRMSQNGDRPSKWLSSMPRVVYIPPGTYEISQTLNMLTDTVLMGDATNPPTIKASANWNGNSVLLNARDPGVGGSGELSFAVSVKNLVLNTENIGNTESFTALEWGVAQAAALQNVKIVMPKSSGGAGHTGINLDQGSTLGLTDTRIENGLYGVRHNGHQQAQYTGITFFQNTIGFEADSGDTIVLANCTFDTVGTAVHAGSGNGAWVGLIDIVSRNSGVTFSADGYPNFMIENLKKDTTSAVANVRGQSVVGARGGNVEHFTYGNTVGSSYPAPTDGSLDRPAALVRDGVYAYKPAPTYENLAAGDFVNVKDSATNGGHTVKGDHSIDESQVLNTILEYAVSQNKPVFFPFGKYRIDSTLKIPIGSRIVGEGWPVIQGYGSYFSHSDSPKPVVQIGNDGDVGTVEISDMHFTVAQRLPGAIIVQFNAAGSQPGDVALWNSLVTVGGTRGADDISSNCYDASNECMAAFVGIHLSKSSSALISNVWNWVADHWIENFDDGSEYSGGSGTSIAAKGGVLVEATKGTWLHALGSEHWWLYQLNFRNAQKVFVGMLQAETNYHQGDKTKQIAPAPWTADVSGWGDPDFSNCGGGDKRCRMGYANYFNGGSDIYTYGSAAWAFFSGPGYQKCADPASCQDYMHWIQNPVSNLNAYGLCSKSSTNILHEAGGSNVAAYPDFTGTNWNGDTHSGLIAAYHS